MLTPEKIKKMDALAGTVTPTTTGNSSRIAELKKLAEANKPKPTLGQEIAGDIKKRGENVYGAITGEAEASKGEVPFVKGVQATGEAFGAVTDVAGRVISKAIPQGVKDRFKQQTEEGKDNPLRKLVKDGFSEVYDKVGVGLDDVLKRLPEQTSKNIESGLKLAESSGKIADSILLTDQVSKGLTKVADKGSKIMQPKVAPQGQVQPTDGIKAKINNYAEKSLKDEWSKPTTLPKSTYKKATEIYKSATDKGHDISDTLVKNKISVADHVDDGNFNTLDTADNLRNDAGKLSNDFLRPSLAEADTYTPKTPVKTLVNSAVQNINSNKTLTQETKDLLIKKIRASESALNKQFPDGLKLVDMHDEKILRDFNSKYSAIGDIAVNNEAIKNKAIADSMRTTLQRTAPPEIPVESFNAELAKNYQTADYLEALNGKKAPVSFAQKVTRQASKIAGASAGSAVGGLAGGVGGYHLGGLIETFFEGIPNPMKASFLKNLSNSNPEAFKQMENYLGAREVERMMQLKLPAPSFTPMGAPAVTDTTSVTSEVAKKNPVTANPQTGKFQTTYNSTPESLLTKDITPQFMKDAETKVKGALKDYAENTQVGLSIKDVSKKFKPEIKTFFSNEPTSNELGQMKEYLAYFDTKVVPEGFKTADQFKKQIRDFIAQRGVESVYDMTDVKLAQFIDNALGEAERVPQLRDTVGRFTSKGSDVGDIEFLTKQAIGSGDFARAREYFDQLPKNNEYRKGMESFFNKK